MDDLKYWEEMVGESFCQNDVKYEPEKIKAVAQDMSAAMNITAKHFIRLRLVSIQCLQNSSP